MRVLFVLSIMIERVGCGIRPHINSLTAYLPALWQQSEEHNMLRCAIVSTLVHLEKVSCFQKSSLLYNSMHKDVKIVRAHNCISS